MVETTTLHYGWTKPEIAHSASTWGGFLNNDLDSIDSLVYANQQGIVPIGSITMFAGAAAPTNWLICDGSSLDTTVYAGLFAILGYVYGGSGANFNLPNLTQKFPMGAGTLAATGGAATVTLDATMIPAHTHPVTLTQTPHSHTASSPAHTHNLTDHTHTVNIVFGGGTEIQSGSGWGQRNQSGGAMTAPVNVGSQAAAVSVDPNNAAVSVTGSATGNTGGGLAHPNLPPYLTVNFIIRAK